MTYSTILARGTASTIVALAGQSNAHGHAAATPVPVKAVEGVLWTHGVVQSNYGTGGNCSVSPLLAPSRRVVKRAIGATSAQNWIVTHQPALFADAVTAGLVPTVTIWIQGEADAIVEADALGYQARLETLLDNFETEWGPQELIVIPLLSMAGSTGYDFWVTVNDAIIAEVALRANAITIATSDLEKRVDNVHYTRLGYDALAKRIRAEFVSRSL